MKEPTVQVEVNQNITPLKGMGKKTTSLSNFRKQSHILTDYYKQMNCKQIL